MLFLTAKVNNNNIYDLSGRMVKLNAKAEDLKSLKKRDLYLQQQEIRS